MGVAVFGWFVFVLLGVFLFCAGACYRILAGGILLQAFQAVEFLCPCLGLFSRCSGLAWLTCALALYSFTFRTSFLR